MELMVNATGLGSAALLGVEDDKVYPARGQTVLVRAPLVKKCIMYTAGFTSGGEAATGESQFGGLRQVSGRKIEMSSGRLIMQTRIILRAYRTSCLVPARPAMSSSA